VSAWQGPTSAIRFPMNRVSWNGDLDFSIFRRSKRDASISIFGSEQFRACSCSKAVVSDFRNALWREIHFDE